MPRITPLLLPRLRRLLTGLGDNIRKARLRRANSLETLAERAGIARKTLYRVERGDPAVALGIYARVLQALRLESDLGSIAADDVLGRKLQDLSLEPKQRAPKRKLREETAREPAEILAPLKRRGEGQSLRSAQQKTSSGLVVGRAKSTPLKHKGSPLSDGRGSEAGVSRAESISSKRGRTEPR